MIGPLPGAETLNFRAEIGRSRDPIDVQLTGSNSETLKKVTTEIETILGSIEGVFDIANSDSRGKQEIQFQLKPQAEALGITISSLARQVRNAFFGVEVQRIQRGRDDVRVMLRLTEAERSSLDKLNELLIVTPSGGKLPLHQLATLKFGKSPSNVIRIDRKRTINVTADVDKATADLTAIRSKVESDIQRLLAQYPAIQFTLEGEAREESELFESIYTSIIFVCLAIYILLAIVFKSYRKPLIVMSIIPLGGVMAVIGHLMMGLSVSMMSILGMLALTGVVVNDSLVLVDYVNKQRELGVSRKEAVLNAGVRRLRPIMLTSLTTFVGLMPIIFDKSTQAQFLIPMGVSLGFGIILSTSIILLMVPMLFYKPKSMVIYLAALAALFAYHIRESWLGIFVG